MPAQTGVPQKGAIVNMRLTPEARRIIVEMRTSLGISQTATVELALRCMQALGQHMPAMLESLAVEWERRTNGKEHG